MDLDFDFQSIQVTEFGVGNEEKGAQTFTLVPVDGDVQLALGEIAAATVSAMDKRTDMPVKYEPAEKHEAIEYVCLPIDDDLATRMRDLQEAHNLPVNAAALGNPARLFCYFARFVDAKHRRLTGLRRATQFKGVLKSRLIRLATDALKLVDDRVFKLDSDFDLLIDAKQIHILRPSGFEFAGKLQEAVLAAVPLNVKEIRHDLPFVDFTEVELYAMEHPRAARYLASIRTLKETKKIDKSALKRLCKRTGVEIKESKGKVTVAPNHVLGFLELLDRRRYEVELVSGAPERFRAASRSKLN
jgi:hypothetical protein